MAKTLEEYLKENPNLNISQADMDLGRQNFGALEEIIKARKDWASATTQEEKDAAHNKAETIRKYYGNYSGGTDGMEGQYSPTYVKPSKAQDEDNIQAIFERLNGAYKGSAPTWTPKYESEIAGILEEIGNREPFEYDMMEDPLYQQYRDQYIREGRKAMEDTAAQTAALTGGYGSTYGSIAAQQGYDNYLAQLNDAVPQLEQIAYGKDRDALADLYNRMGALQTEEQRLYGQYLDALGQYNTDRSFAYGAMADAMSQNNYEKEFDRGIFESDRDYALTKDTTQWEMDQTERQNAIENALAIGDYSALRELGYDTSYLDFLQQVERAQGNEVLRAAQEAYTKATGKSSSGGGTKSGDDEEKKENGESAKNKARAALMSVYMIHGDSYLFDNAVNELVKKGIVTEADYNDFVKSIGK